MDKLQQILLCAWELLDAREWGRRTKDPWSIQVEMDWAEEIQIILKLKEEQAP